MILQAAVEVYAEEGYHAATMDKIAEQAELSRATLYLYFKTKDEIFVHAIVSFSDYFGDLLEQLFARRHELQKNIIRELWQEFIRFYSKDPIAFNLTLYFHQKEMLRALTMELRLLMDQSGSRNYRLLSQIMEFGLHQGYVKPCNPKTLAEVVWTSFLGIIHLENSKHAMQRKNHLDLTWDLAYAVIERGIMHV